MDNPVPEAPHDRVAIVTGAARGIGQALARGLAAEGTRVAAVDIRDSEDTRAAIADAGGTCHVFEHDVTDPETTDGLVGGIIDAFGRGPDILVNNAGVLHVCDAYELDYADWRRVLSINLDGAFLMCRAVIPHMKRNGWGRIVNISSNSVGFPVAGYTHYMASKLGLVGLTRGLATDVANDGITVNAVGPSITATPGMLEDVPQERLDRVSTLQAIKRPARPEDLVGTVRFLSSEEAHWVTGQTIMADGGLVRL